ncbi:hypothetical protein ACP70R_033509 [Stipagrostis hirtigluma subsp. patula]
MYISWGVMLLVLGVIFCPVMALFWFGLYISPALSIWRLIEHDYGNADGGANLVPALDLLYSLAVAQGVLSRFRSFYSFISRTNKAVELVKESYQLHGTKLVSVT